jgi:SNF2 family DNA or RNA helicase
MPPHYINERGLFDFQAYGVAEAYYRPSSFVLWDTGLGKTHLAMALAALLVEDGLIDQTLVLAEKPKIKDWVDDFSFFTDLPIVKYHGDKKRRERLRGDLHGDPGVWVSSYETVRNDSTVKRPGSKRALDPGPFAQELLGQRVLFVFDEMTKLKSRGSQAYRAIEHLLKWLRKDGEVRALGMTATPIERGVDNAFNAARLLHPGICTVEYFDENYVRWRHPQHGYPISFKNLNDMDHPDPHVPTLRSLMEPILMIKSKDDPDVRDQFPKLTEEFHVVEMTPKQRRFYEVVEEEYESWVEDDIKWKGVYHTVLRQIAGHPLSLLTGEGKMSADIVARVGRDGLADLGSGKTDRLVHDMSTIVQQGAQALVYSFFGPSILPLLQEALSAAGIDSAVHSGHLSAGENGISIDRFKAGDVPVLLSSDAGSRGLNLHAARYITHYELPSLYSVYEQRSNRSSRIDSTLDIVTVDAYVAADSVEDGIFDVGNRRNSQHVRLFDEDSTEARDRRKMMDKAKKELERRYQWQQAA